MFLGHFMSSFSNFILSVLFSFDSAYERIMEVEELGQALLIFTVENSEFNSNIFV